jgi:hypothetical protein
VTPYPFGSDGNPVTPDEPLCAMPAAASGPGWTGDFNPEGGDVPGNPACYLQVNSFAFRAWNWGLAATGLPFNASGTASAPVGFGVWIYNGTNWFPDPTFPGSNVCPGSVVLWAGKLDYWLVGPAVSAGTRTPETTLCRFDGVNLEWEPLSLPAATLAELPVNSLGKPQGGITSGACYAWNNCWFFGNDGIEVHWDGQALSNVSNGVGDSPWLDGDVAAAVAATDPSGNPFGLAVTKSTMTTGTGAQTSLPAAPDGSPPSQVFGSQGGPWTPVRYSPSTSPLATGTTDLTAISANAEGDVWVAGSPNHNVTTENPPQTAPAPLERLTDTGTSVCAAQGPGGNGFTLAFPNGYQWEALSTFPDGSALAGAHYYNSAISWSNPFVPPVPDSEPQLVDAACGQVSGPPEPPIEFRRQDPLVLPADQTPATLIPADENGYVSAVAANASNDAWAATTDGAWPFSNAGGTEHGGFLAPHFYEWTDGQTPDAPAGNNLEARPSVFTLSPPVYIVGSPTVVVTPGAVTTTKKKGKAKKRKLKPAIYDIHDKLARSSNGSYILYLTFKVRRPVTIGLEGLRGHTVVASTGLKHFTRRTGQLALTLDRKHWPTRLSLVTPKKSRK